MPVRRSGGDDLAESHAARGNPDDLALLVPDQVRPGLLVPFLQHADHLAHVAVGQLVLERDAAPDVPRTDQVLAALHRATVAARGPHAQRLRLWTSCHGRTTLP